MSRLHVERGEDGSLVVSGIPALLARVIRQLPGLLGADQPEVVRRRLYPDPTDDEETAAEWRRAQHPELFALLADSKRIVERDLASLREDELPQPEIEEPAEVEANPPPEPEPSPALEVPTWSLPIPAAHVTAWISAINAGRLVLGSLYEVTAADLSSDCEPVYDERGLAILRIELYQWLQSALIHAVWQDE